MRRDYVAMAKSVNKAEGWDRRVVVDWSKSFERDMVCLRWRGTEEAVETERLLSEEFFESSPDPEDEYRRLVGAAIEVRYSEEAGGARD